MSEAVMEAILEQAYLDAVEIVEERAPDNTAFVLGDSLAEKCSLLADTKNAARGVATTLIAYKLVDPNQDIRSHKAEHDGGFSARTYDTGVTVPFLIAKSLPRNVETHWLSQTFSFAGPYLPGSVLRTQPKAAGQLLIDVVNAAQNGTTDQIKAMLVKLMVGFIKIRNADKVVLTRPKDLPIHKVRSLIQSHLSGPYRANAPRLPQLVIYAVYSCLVQSVGRYSDAHLEPLERMKSADRKKGTIGDIVVTEGKRRIEAVEIKHDQPITFVHVAEAIDKVRAESVTRYYILSNRGVEPSDKEKIENRVAEFLKQNGCEIIINGVLDSLSYYLRLLPDTTDFLCKYADILGDDEDTSYEHRIKWNECCDSL